MTAPRLEIDLAKIHHNARTLVDRLGARHISVTGVTKATLGSPEIAAVLLRAGVTGLGDSRIENIQAMRRAHVAAPMTLIRSPMLSQVDRVVALADVSFNSEIDVISELSSAAGQVGRTHGVVLMVELGDLREGILPRDLERAVRDTLRLPNIALRGIGTNLACRSGVSPDARNMAELSALAESIEARFGIELGTVSGGNSANLEWALSDADPGRINDLRLGESLLLGRETLHRKPIDGLYTDAITLVAEAPHPGHGEPSPVGRHRRHVPGRLQRAGARDDVSVRRQGRDGPAQPQPGIRDDRLSAGVAAHHQPRASEAADPQQRTFWILSIAHSSSAFSITRGGAKRMVWVCVSLQSRPSSCSD
jgi:predicted amino acid racemase